MTHLLSQYYQQIAGKLQGNGVSSFWYTNVTNFGDLLTPALLKSYGLRPIFSDRFGGTHAADLVCVGSILQLVPPSYGGIILGSGLIAEEYQRTFPNARIIALRGERTKALVQCTQDIPLGDPGLLAYRLIEQQGQKKHPLGVVPHQIEMDEGIGRTSRGWDKRIKLIDPRRPPAEVIQDISECECVLSSSLHGLIVSDALGIPNGRLHLSDRLYGGDFKFDDYYSAFNTTRDKHTVTGKEDLQTLVSFASPPPEMVATRQAQLHDLFSSLKDILIDHRS